MHDPLRSSRLIRRGSDRRGATTVEFSIAAPILFFFFFTAMEFGRMQMLRHTVVNAAYEGARRGVVPGATAADVEAAARSTCSLAHARGVSVQVTPSVITDTTTQVAAMVSVPLDQNAWVIPKLFRGTTLTSTTILNREKYSGAP
jgi:Flp pilus assembly protein TadG